MFSRLFIHSPIRYIFSLLVIIGVVLGYNFGHDNSWGYVVYYSNSFFIAGAILVAIGAFSCMDFYGFFNMFRYIFVRRDPTGHRITLSEYTERRGEKIKDKKFRYVPYLLLGVICLIVATILFIINKNLY